MNRDLLLALDNGTQSVRALLFDAQGKRIARSAVALHYQRADARSCELAPEQFWQAACTALQQLWSQQPDARARVAALAVTTQRATVIALDDQDQPVHPAIIWMDQRRAQHAPSLGPLWESVFALLGARDIVRGFQRDCEAQWLREQRPQAYARIRRYGLLSAYLNWQLTGDWVDASASQVGYLPFDFRRQQWAAQGWRSGGLPLDAWKWRACPIAPEWLPRLAPANSVLGQVSARAAAQTGLPAGLPVIAAGADKACEVLGSGCLTPEHACLSYGTTATVNVSGRRYLEPARLLPPYPAAAPGHYTAEFQIYRGYWLVSWFKEQFGFPEQDRARELGGVPEQFFDQLALSVPPGADGLVLQPYWSPGVRDPGPEARGAVIGWHDGHTRAHLYRAILEGIAYGLRQGLEGMERRAGLRVPVLRVSGGGARSDAALQLTADIFNRPAERPEETETSGLGAAICAAVGLGWHDSSASAIRAMCRTGRVFTPEPATAARYEHLYRQVYLPLYRRLKPLYRALEQAR